MTVLNDSEKLDTMQKCSDNILKFIKALDNGDETIKWSRLDKDGCKMQDGTYFRIVCGWRSADQQIEEYKKGRSGVQYSKDMVLFSNEYVYYTPAWKPLLRDKGKIVSPNNVSTYAWAGSSYHNYGLAIDICVRKFGDDNILHLSDGDIENYNYLKLIGLVELAEKCGLAWGAEKNFKADFLHFEDTAYSLPSEEYNYNTNYSFDFVKNLEKNKKLLNGGLSELKKGGLLALLCGIAYFVGRKRR